MQDGWRRVAGLLACGLGLAACAGAQTPVADEAPAALSAEEDHSRMLDLLGIEVLRPGRDGMNPDAPNYANYDEATSNPYPDLPPLLEAQSGAAVTSPEMWRDVRRPELISLFSDEIYGHAPETTPAVTWEVVSEHEAEVGGVPVLAQALTGRVDNAACPGVSVEIDMTLTRPLNAEGPVPAVLSFIFQPPPGWEPPEGWTPPPGPTATERVLARGWAHAELVPTSVQADTGGGLTEGIIGLVNCREPRDPEDWGALRAWAWGASRALDHLEAAPEIDGTRVAVEGLSRYGKAVLVTMAYDERFAMGFSGSSGEAGASLYRRDNGETLENVASSGEYHWMAGNFLKYAGPLGWDDLPIDAHSLVALSAPRPLFVGTGTAEEGDAWVDPKGIYMATAEASEAYALFGKAGVPEGQWAGAGTTFTDGALAFRQHEGGHTNGPNWEAFLDWAERYVEPR